jgi:hypothetical protein
MKVGDKVQLREAPETQGIIASWRPIKLLFDGARTQRRKCRNTC